MSNAIPVLNLKGQYEEVAPALEEAVLALLRSGNYILGENVSRLEKELATLSGCKHGIGVANGTDALILALWVLDIGPGDEVITPAFTFAATAEAIALRGATPVFVDIDPLTFNIDPKLIEKAITSKTKAIMPVHLYGLPAEMDAISALAKKYSLKVIEDNAQAIGAHHKGRPTGSMSDVASVSFYPTKNLGACGDAGLLVTNNDTLAERLRALRAHGMRKRYYHDELGVNSRLDEIQAAILLAKLPYLEKWTVLRQKTAELYDKTLKACPGIITPAIPNQSTKTTHVWHQYTIRIAQLSESNNDTTRDTVVSELAKRNIGSMCYYPVPLHLQKAFSYLDYSVGDLPITEQLSKEVLSLPMYPELTEAQVNSVANTLKEIFQNLTAHTSQPKAQAIMAS